jgi:hypothetical protein
MQTFNRGFVTDDSACSNTITTNCRGKCTATNVVTQTQVDKVSTLLNDVKSTFNSLLSVRKISNTIAIPYSATTCGAEGGVPVRPLFLITNQ